MEKNNRGLVIAVVVLTICVLGMGSFIVYDQVFAKENTAVEPKKEEPKKEEPQQPEEPKKEQDELENKPAKFSWYENDADVIWVDYRSIQDEGTVNGLHIKRETGSVDCEINVDEQTYTDKYTINGKIQFEDNECGCSTGHAVYLYKDYIIVMSFSGCIPLATTSIYDKNGNFLKSVESATCEYNVDCDNETVPVIHNGKLYYYVGTGYIDLTNEKLIEEINMG